MSITKNFLFNSSITVSSYVASFITFPYVSRILGVDNLGIFSYVDNVISYFVLFIMLGVQTVGIREIASSGNSIEKRSKVFFSLTSFLLISLLVVCLIYTICIFNIPQLYQYKRLFLIGYSKLVFGPLMMEWVFSGMQDFKYISSRTILVRILYVISVFIFVKNSDDIILYFALTCGSTLVSFIINIISLRKYISFSYVIVDLKPYFKPIFKIGSFSLIVSLYTSFNYIFLRNVSNETEVGLYYTAIRLYMVILALFMAFTNVMMPRVSELLNEGDTVRVKQYLDKSFNSLFSFCFPLMTYSLLMTPFIINVIAGKGYEGAILPMRIVMPLLLIAGLNQINGVQVLIPLRKDNVLLVTSSLSALSGLICNILLTKTYGAIGCATCVLASELTGCISGYFYSIKNKIFVFPLRSLFYHLFTSLPYIMVYVVVYYLCGNTIICNLLISFLFIAYFLYSQICIIKNQVVLSFISKIKYY